MKKKTEYSLKELLENIGCDFSVHGNLNNSFNNFCSIYKAKKNSVCWIRAEGNDAIKIIKDSPASILICKAIEVSELIIKDKTLIFVKNPHLAYLRLLSNIQGHNYLFKAGIHPTAIISPEAKIGKNISIGPNVIVGKCDIGDNCTIKSNAIIHDNVEIGSNVLISENCNIGGEGFGFIKNELNQLENMLHIGRLIIENNVSIFPFTNIDRSTLDETIIGGGTKIDHYCHIGHNSKIGKNNIITANVTTLGGVQIGNECMIGCGSMFREGVIVGNNVTVGMASVVTKNIPNNETWVGSPARSISDFKLLQIKLLNLLKQK